MSAAPKLLGNLKFSIVVDPDKGKSESLTFDRSITIGRLPENDVVIANDPRVSRQHVRIEIEGDSLKLTTLNAKNPFLVDNKKLEKYYLNMDECFIQIGQTKLKIQVQRSFGRVEEIPISVSPAQNPLINPAQGVANPVSNDSPLVKIGPSHNHPMIEGIVNSAPATLSKNKAQAPPRPRKGKKAPKKSGKMTFYIVIGMVLIASYILMDGESSSSPTRGIRTAEEIQADLARAQMRMDEIRQQNSDSGKDSRMYESAQAYYVRGFRDYRQGQFRRAMQSFQAALSFYPNHQLAMQYLKMAEVQADRMDRANMSQGRKYRDRGHYDLCQAAFQRVMTSIKDTQNALYKEAQVLHDECATLSEGRY